MLRLTAGRVGRPGDLPGPEAVEHHPRRPLRHHEEELHRRPRRPHEDLAHLDLPQRLEVDLREDHARGAPPLEPVHRVQEHLALRIDGTAARVVAAREPAQPMPTELVERPERRALPPPGSSPPRSCP